MLSATFRARARALSLRLAISLACAALVGTAACGSGTSTNGADNGSGDGGNGNGNGNGGNGNGNGNGGNGNGNGNGGTGDGGILPDGAPAGRNDGGDDGAVVPACTFPPIESSETVNVAVTTVAVSGTVTMNGGQALAEETTARGSLLFTLSGQSQGVSVSLGTTGAASYSTTLFAGTYDIQLSGSGSGLPAQTIVLARGVSITTPTTENFDVATATLDANVLINGATMPDNTTPYTYGDPNRGTLQFYDGTQGSTVQVSLGESGPAQFTLSMFAGTYDVELLAGAYQNSFPEGGTVLATAFPISGAVSQEFNGVTTTISGTVTVDGGVMPDASNLRGTLYFSNNATGSSEAFLGTTGPATYSTTVFIGSYDVSIDGTSYQTVLPYEGIYLQNGLAVTGATTQNYDLHVGTLSGAVTINGTTMADNSSTESRGTLELVEQTSGATVSADLGATGSAAYSTPVFAGTYDVYVAGASSYQDVLPPGRVKVAGGLTIGAGATSQNFDAKVSTITGTVTVNGAVMPDSTGTSDRGEIVFQSSAGSTFSATLGATGPATYSLSVFNDSYDVVLAAGAATSQSAIPALSTPLACGVTVSGNASRTDDAKTVRISGTITMNGARLPADDAGTSLGSLEIANVDAPSSFSLDLGASGATYSTTVFAGGYDLYLVGSSGATPLPAETLQVENGCRGPTACSAP
jgi:hypothetical protein